MKTTPPNSARRKRRSLLQRPVPRRRRGRLRPSRRPRLPAMTFGSLITKKTKTPMPKVTAQHLRPDLPTHPYRLRLRHNLLIRPRQNLLTRLRPRPPIRPRQNLLTRLRPRPPIRPHLYLQTRLRPRPRILQSPPIRPCRPRLRHRHRLLPHLRQCQVRQRDRPDSHTGPLLGIGGYG